jgi:DNA-binding NarL/FixJ family response regulator
MGGDCGKALVVDGDKAARDLVVELLGRAGFDSITVKRGDEALMESRARLPWLVVSEVRLPDISGFELCRQLRHEFGDEFALVFVSADRTEPMDRATGMLLGGDDYIVKPFDASEFLARVRRLWERVAAPRSDALPEPVRRQPPTTELTRRELEVLSLLARGRRSRDIAADLSIGEKTVASHLQRVLGKLGVHSRAQAVAIAYRKGLVSDANHDLSSA